MTDVALAYEIIIYGFRCASPLWIRRLLIILCKLFLISLEFFKLFLLLRTVLLIKLVLPIVVLTAEWLLIVVWLGYLPINRRTGHVLIHTWRILRLCIVYILGRLVSYLLRSYRSWCILAVLKVLILLCHFIRLHRGAYGDARLGGCFSSTGIILLILYQSCWV